MADLTAVERARELVLERCSILDAEEVPVREALGRVLAEDVTSPEDVPGFDNSAMDGFAVRAEDTSGATAEAPVALRIGGESRAGAPAQAPLNPGEAFTISTGAMVPEGADAVVRVEDTAQANGRVEMHVEVRPGRDIRRAGDDIRSGDAVLARGAEVGPAEVGVAASVARDALRCARRPGVAVLSTGDELLEPSEPMRPGGVRNSNAHSVPALVAQAGAEVESVRMLRDDLARTREGIEEALAADVVVLCGGVSVGEHDHVRPALAELGVEQVFWGIALRPGKPTFFGVQGGGPGEGGALVFGLPGNPVSAMVTFILLCRPAIRAMLGAGDDTRSTTAILDEGYRKPPGRMHAVRCRLELRDDGWHARPSKEQGSHVLTSMVGADALAMIPTESGDVEAGERVEIQLLR